jgi:hypothetical protein
MGLYRHLNNGSNKTFVIQLHGKNIQNSQKFIRFSGRFDRIRHINVKNSQRFAGHGSSSSQKPKE